MDDKYIAIESEKEEEFLSSSDILTIVAMVCITAVVIMFGVLSYISGLFWAYMGIWGILGFFVVIFKICGD